MPWRYVVGSRPDGSEQNAVFLAVTFSREGEDLEVHLTLWLLLACGSACTALSVFLPPPTARMRTIDIIELRRRRRLFEILAANTRTPSGHPASPPSSVDDPAVP
jgi:hypothetical protein